MDEDGAITQFLGGGPSSTRGGDTRMGRVRDRARAESRGASRITSGKAVSALHAARTITGHKVTACMRRGNWGNHATAKFSLETATHDLFVVSKHDNTHSGDAWKELADQFGSPDAVSMYVPPHSMVARGGGTPYLQIDAGIVDELTYHLLLPDSKELRAYERRRRVDIAKSIASSVLLFVLTFVAFAVVFNVFGVGMLDAVFAYVAHARNIARRLGDVWHVAGYVLYGDTAGEHVRG